jgi:hypothetical protein
MERSELRYQLKQTHQGIVVETTDDGVRFDDLPRQLTHHPNADWQQVDELSRFRIAKRLKQVQRLPIDDVTLLDDLLKPPLLLLEDRTSQDFQYRLEVIATADHGADFYFDCQLVDEAHQPQLSRGKLQLTQQEIEGLLNFFRL